MLHPIEIKRISWGYRGLHQWISMQNQCFILKGGDRLLLKSGEGFFSCWKVHWNPYISGSQSELHRLSAISSWILCRALLRKAYSSWKHLTRSSSLFLTRLCLEMSALRPGSSGEQRYFGTEPRVKLPVTDFWQESLSILALLESQGAQMAGSLHELVPKDKTIL